jgi:RNA polymerase sigma-70 factor (ECF subfamily)
MIGRSDVVEDLTQLVFIKMVRALDRLQAPAQFESWLFRLARNTCIDHLRRQKLRRIFVPFAPEHEDVAEPAGAVDTEELDALRHALAQIRPQDRALLALVQEGRSHAEIAETLNSSVAAVKARLHRAREQLRQHYQSPHEP